MSDQTTTARRPLSIVLTELIVVAGEVLTRPGKYRLRAGCALPDDLVRLAGEIEAWHARPAELIRRTNAGWLLKNAIVCFHHADTDALAGRWLMVIGALLPMLRDDAEQALCNERGVPAGEYRR